MSDSLRGTQRAALVAFCTLVLAAYVALNWEWFRSVCDRSGDYALIRLQTERASRFEALEGPYSRFGLRHPAPTYFYLYSALSPLGSFTETRQGNQSFSQFLINAAFLVCAALLAARVFRSILGGGAFITLMLIFTEFARPGALSDIWGPSTLIAPVACFLLASAVLATGELTIVPLWILSAALPLSNHLASIVLLAPIGLITGALGVIARKRRGGALCGAELGALVLSALLLSIIALPVVIEAARAGGGNLLALMSFGSGASKPLPSSPLASFEFLAAYYTKPLALRGWDRIALTMCLVALPWLPPRSPGREARLLRVLLTLAVPFGVMGVESAPGKEYRYVLMFWFGVGALQWVIAADWIARVAGAAVVKLTKSGEREKRVNRLLSAAAALLIVAGTVGFFPALKRPVRECGGVYDRAAAKILEAPADLYAVSIKHPSQWGALAALVDRMYASGAEPCVQRLWDFMFTDSLVCTREKLCHPHRRTRQFVLLRREDPQPPESREVAEAGSMRIAELADDWRETTCAR